MATIGAEFVVPCGDLEATIDWFVEQAGFRMVMLRPADDPTVATIEGHGVTVRLDRSLPASPSSLRIAVDELPAPAVITGPNATRIEFVLANPPEVLPPNEPVFAHARAADAEFGAGRAGMGYRDLIPERQGGRYIASHISIPVGGPVPDYVHHHHIRLQLIFCHAGWADLVYEDQGPAFRFEAGDCVLQPPHIRHQVLHTSDEFEVVEVSSPAEHDTLRDHELSLPTPTINVDRDYGGQRFVWHKAASAEGSPWRFDGFQIADTGIGAATNGLAQVGLVRPDGGNAGTAVPEHRCGGEFTFWFVRSGTANLLRSGQPIALASRDSVVLDGAEQYALESVSTDFEILEVRVP